MDETFRSEEALVGQAKGRSPQAWTHIYQTYYRKIFLYAYARVQDQSTAEDLASTVFLEALISIRTYNYRGRPLLAWLYRIARNVVSDHLAAKARRREVLTKALPFRVIGHFRSPQPAEATPVSREPSAMPGPSVDWLDVKEALSKLTPQQREVIVLHYFVGFTIPETARLLGKKEVAVYSLQARAIMALRRQMRA